MHGQLFSAANYDKKFIVLLVLLVLSMGSIGFLLTRQNRPSGGCGILLPYNQMASELISLERRLDMVIDFWAMSESRANQLESMVIKYELEMARLAGASYSQFSELRLYEVGSRTSVSREGVLEVGGRRLIPVGTWELTAYNPVVWQCDEDPWTTASGARTKPGYTCAIDRAYWSFGTRFWVAGYGEVIAEDTGSKVKGRNRMDICISDVQMARTLGRWHAAVYLISP